MTDDRRDEVIAKALRDVPVPEHAPQFWSDLDRSIRASGDGAPAHAATSAAPKSAPARGEPRHRRLDTGELPSVTALAPERERRRSGRAPILAAAAGVLVLAGAVAMVLWVGGGDGDNGDDLASSPSEPITTAAAGQDESRSDIPTPALEPEPTAAPGEIDSPGETVQAWLDGLGTGDVETSAALTGPRSAHYIESLGTTVEQFLADSQEGYGAWAGADVDVRSTEVGPVDLLGGKLAIVSVSGTYPGEGDPVFRVDVFPVVDEGQGWRVEHLAYDPARENALVFTVPQFSAGRDGQAVGAMNPTDDVNVFVPANGTVFFQFDGGELDTDATSLVGRDPEPFALYNPPSDLGAGSHQLVVVAVGDDGTITYFGGVVVVPA